MRDPLETRSLPGRPWEHAPESLKELDEDLRSKIVSLLDDSSALRASLKWLIESHLAIGLFFAVLLAMYFIAKSRQNHRSLFANLKASLGPVLYVAVWAGLSDLTSMQLKIFFGRLKPHVEFYNPNFLPALSLPSNHAFNTAMLFVLLSRVFAWKAPLRSFAALVVLFIGFSRILLGQHYPLDVLAGWFFGGTLGYLASVIWLSRKPKA